MSLPERKHLVHKPVEPRNLGKKLQDRDLETGDWLWQIKYDGCCCIAMVENHVCRFYSREGNEAFSLDHIGFELDAWPNGVYMGEVWAPGIPFSDISGLFRRQKSSEETAVLQFMLFDYIPLDHFLDGFSPLCFDFRWIELVSRFNFHYRGGPVDLARTCVGGSIHQRTMVEYVYRQQEKGLWETDGYVAKERAGTWCAGAGKGGEQIKVKDHMSVDLRVLGLEMGEGKFSGMVGSLTCDYNGEILQVGGGKLTTQERAYYWQNKDKLVGKIVEVHGLKGSTNGLIREPRFHRIRDDKVEPSV